MRLRDSLPRLIRSSELRRLREIEEEWNEENPPHDPEAFARFMRSLENGYWKIGHWQVAVRQRETRLAA